jgi:hypothetical protein
VYPEEFRRDVDADHGLTHGNRKDMWGSGRRHLDAGLERASVVVYADVVDAQLELAALLGLSGEG